MLAHYCNRIRSGSAHPALLQDDHIVLMAIDGVLAAYAAVRRWLECRHTLRALGHLDERLLRDIGVTRAEAWRENRRWWQGRDKSRQALAALDDSQLSNLSDFGRQMRRQAQRDVRLTCKTA